MHETELKTGRRQTQIGVIKVEPSCSLFLEGDLNKELYLLETGRLRVTQGQGNLETHIAVLKPGAIVGEMALFDGQPRSANVYAEVPSLVKVIPKAAFDKMIGLLPIWLRAIIKIVVVRVREANQRLEQSTIPCPTLSLAQFLQLEIKTRSITSFDYFETSDNYAKLSRATQAEFKQAITKLEQNQIINFNDEDSGSQSIIVSNPKLLDAIVTSFKDHRYKRPIRAQDLNDDSQMIIKYIEGRQALKLPLNQPKKQFIKGFQSKLARSGEHSMAQLIDYCIICIDDDQVHIKPDKLKQLKLEISALSKLKALLS